MKGDMDLSVLPNNNHPDKFLQLDVKSLMRSSTLLQASLARFPGGNYPATQHWQNLVYSQAPWDLCHEIIQSQRHSDDYSPGASQRKSVRWSEKPAVLSTISDSALCLHTKKTERKTHVLLGREKRTLLLNESRDLVGRTQSFLKALPHPCLQ
ncbi:major intrinsically disordered NOTCH2-binding receptor 1-like isoform X3 [Rattus norvegicus]|uniref:major intrinsically disordered NOTCH2-binding receptor 1-like isoform X3 n=1 Tax=Rattus norvegicus TaxID=10116 RepID=UPI0019178038|nr:major intrinsically disordered NOTCH2-binding receptor 1-like isoform X1 [Rattus norvegicus]